MSNISFLGIKYSLQIVCCLYCFDPLPTNFKNYSHHCHRYQRIHYQDNIPHHLNFLLTRQYLPQSRFSVFLLWRRFCTLIHVHIKEGEQNVVTIHLFSSLILVVICHIFTAKRTTTECSGSDVLWWLLCHFNFDTFFEWKKHSWML